MLTLMNEFFIVLQSMASIQETYPVAFDTLIHDYRFNTVSDLGSKDWNEWYDKVFAEIQEHLEVFHNKHVDSPFPIRYVCDSCDVFDRFTDMDFSYYTGHIGKSGGFVYYDPTHPWGMPKVLVLYSPEFQIMIKNSASRIRVYESDSDLFGRLFGDEDNVCQVKDYLKHTDREI